LNLLKRIVSIHRNPRYASEGYKNNVASVIEVLGEPVASPGDPRRPPHGLRFDCEANHGGKGKARNEGTSFLVIMRFMLIWKLAHKHWRLGAGHNYVSGSIKAKV
jgi:hypothetical protein